MKIILRLFLCLCIFISLASQGQGLEDLHAIDAKKRIEALQNLRAQWDNLDRNIKNQAINNMPENMGSSVSQKVHQGWTSPTKEGLISIQLHKKTGISMLNQQLIEMALWDPAITVQMEAEQTLKFIYPLNEKEQKAVFQLSSPLLYERKEALFVFNSLNSLKDNPFLQYIVLKTSLLDSHDWADKDYSPTRLPPTASSLIHAFASSHLLIQQVLLKALNYPFFQHRAQERLQNIHLSPHIQRELILSATAQKAPSTSLAFGQKPSPQVAYSIIAQTVHSLNEEVEKELVRLAISDSTIIKTKAYVDIDQAFEARDSSYLAYSLLMERKNKLLFPETQKELAHFIGLNNKDISDRMRARAISILQNQTTYHVETQQELLNSLISSSPLDQVKSAIKDLLMKRSLHPDMQQKLIRMSSADYTSPDVKKIARSLLIHVPNLEPEHERKLHFLLRCQRIAFS